MYLLFKINNQIVRVGIVLLAYIGAYIYSYLKMPFLPWAIDVVPIGIGFMYVGILIHQWKSQIMQSWKKIIGIACFTFILFISSYYVSGVVLKNSYFMHARIFGNVFLNTLAAITGSLCVIMLCSLCKKRHRWLLFIGRNSMAYYGIQAIIVGILNTIFWKLFPNMTGIFGFLISFVSLVISIFVDTVAVRLYEKRISPLWKRMLE